jgi:hypothetical protein
MPTSRPERFTVIQTNGLAQSRICFRAENEPIFRYRRPGLNPVRGAHFARIQTQANSQYAIQKTAVNSGSGDADHQGAPAAISILAFADPLQKIKNEAISHPATAAPECEAPLAAMLSPGQPAYERTREGRPSRLILTRRPACPPQHYLALAVWSMYSWQATCRI